MLFLSLLPLAIGQTASLFGFLPNSGQFPSAVRFVRYSSDNFFYLTRDSFVLRNGIRVQLAGIDPAAGPIGDSSGSTVYNLYRGQDSSQWLTNQRSFGAVKIDSAYPGVAATFTTALANFQPAPSLGEGKVIFAIAPFADPSAIRLRVVDPGASWFQGPNGVSYAGGSSPGVFNVSVSATQRSAAAPIPVTCSFNIESDGTLSLQLSGRDPSVETDVEVTFPDGDVSSSPLAGGFLTASIAIPSDFGQDGASGSNCAGICRDALVARIDDQGSPVWVTLFGGTGDDQAGFATAAGDGVSVSGITSSSDFPVTSTAPHATLSAFQDVYLAFLDGVSGQLRTATYAGLRGAGVVGQQAVDSAGQTAIGGSSGAGGFILLWRPTDNAVVYSSPTSSPVRGLAIDANSNLYFTAVPGPGTILAGELDATGAAAGSVVPIGLPTGTQAGSVRLQPGPGSDFWVAYEALQTASAAPPAVWAARVSPSAGIASFNNQIAAQGFLSDVGPTSSANLKLLVRGAAPTEATTSDAALVAACPGSSYFAILSPDGQLVNATYTSPTAFDFATQNESSGPPPPAVVCFANSAGRAPNTAAAPGELITITGGGFGPVDPLQTAPGADGTFPLTAVGFQVKIGGIDAPLFSVARGLIAVQVPYELASVSQSGQSLAIELSQDGQPLNSIPITISGPALSLFDTADRNNPLRLPLVVALNEDGTANSPDNPAAGGSVVTLFGSGLGVLAPPLPTGGLSPASPSTSSVRFQSCVGCSELLSLGSAPGMSTGIAQITVRIPANSPGSGVRPLGIGVVASDSFPGLSAGSPTGVVFVK